MSTIIDIIRHGEPVGGKKYRGQIDDPLSDKGWRQMWDAVGGHSPWTQIVSSPLRRCREFAQALSEMRGLPMSVDDRFKEVGFGCWEGRSRDDVSTNDKDLLTRFKLDPVNHRPEGAEALQDFCDRVEHGWRELISAHRDRHVLLVAHAGIVRAVMHLALEIPLASIYRIDVDNASITRIQIDTIYDRDLCRLVFHNGALYV